MKKYYQIDWPVAIFNPDLARLSSHFPSRLLSVLVLAMLFTVPVWSQNPEFSSTVRINRALNADKSGDAAMEQREDATSCRVELSVGCRLTHLKVSYVSDNNLFSPPRKPSGASLTPRFCNCVSDHDKIRLALCNAFLNGSSYITNGLSAGLTQITDKHNPQKTAGDNAADYFSRYARTFGTSRSQILLGYGLYPIIFKQDPIYKPSTDKEIKKRILYAASRVVVTRNDKGENKFNWSLVGSHLTADSLANIWEQNTPGHKRIGTGPTFARFGESMGSSLGLYLSKEFWPEIRSLLHLP